MFFEDFLDDCLDERDEAHVSSTWTPSVLVLGATTSSIAVISTASHAMRLLPRLTTEMSGRDPGHYADESLT